MPGPAIVAGLAAAAKIAARNYAKDLAKKEAAKTVAKKGATKAAKKVAASGSGKLKYKNTIKEARVNTKQAEKMDRLAGKKLSKSEAQARTRNAKNLPKQIAKEEKIRTGVNTAKPTTPKVAIKKKAGKK
jgi:hypothetical protein